LSWRSTTSLAPWMVLRRRLTTPTTAIWGVMWSYSHEITSMQWGTVLCASLLAAIWDLRSRRIPNVLTLPLFASGIVASLVTGGLLGLGSALGGCVLVALPYVLLLIFAGGGAGDAKMMGAIGAWLGIEAGLTVLMAVAVTGAALGLLNLAARRQLAAGLGRIGASFYVMTIALCSGRKGWVMVKPDREQSTEVVDRRLTMPYGPAIFIGVCIGALVVHTWRNG